jgi:exodeoxyribonuclease VII large subunit
MHRMHRLTTHLVRYSPHFLQMSREKQIAQKTRIMARGAEQIVQANHLKWEALKEKLSTGAIRMLSSANQNLIHIEKLVGIMDPVNVLKRGYSITMANRHIVKSAEEVKKGDILTTTLPDGRIISMAQTIEKTEHHE